MRSIGVFGGTFDPVHYGHLQLAAAALEECVTSELLFVPSASPPHKATESVCSFEHRLAMLRCAVEGNEKFDVSDLESHLAPPSYTFDTLEHIRSVCTVETNIFFIIGCDAFLDIESWYRWRDVLFSTNFLVAVRPGFQVGAVDRFLVRHGFVQSNVNSNHWSAGAVGNRVLLLSCTTEDISSTDLRHRISQGKNWNHLVPDSVAHYIERHSLYRVNTKLT